jgi:hypothetical protein
MATPSQLSDIVDVTVVVQSIRVGRTPFSKVCVASEFALPAQWALESLSRAKTYIGDAEEVDDAMEDDGFTASSAARRMARAVLRQVPAPDRVVVGRLDPADVSLAAGLTAIKAAEPDWYGLAVDVRSSTDVQAVSAWANAQFALYVAQNKDAAVLTATAGNCLATLKAANHKRTVFLWHDPSTASGLAAAKIYTGSAGPWDLSAHAGTIANVEIDGTSTAVTFDAAAASVLGSDATPADITADLPGQIDIEVDNDGTTHSVALVAADFAAPATPLASELGAKIVATITASRIAAADAGGGDAGKIRISSVRLGTGSQIDIKNTSTANILTAFGLSVGVTNGTGDASNAAAVTPAEIVTLFNGDLAGSPATAITTGVLDDYVSLESPTTGEFSTIRVLGAALNEVLRFTASLTTGTGTDEDYSDCAWLGGRLGGLNLDAPRPQGHVTWDNFRPDGLDGRIKADVLTTAQRVNVREQGGNTFELRTTDRTPGEIHFGRCTDGTYADSRVGADWLAYRMAERVKASLDEAADAGTQIDYTDDGARTQLRGDVGDVLLRADQFGLLVADLEEPDPSSGKVTGLTIPTLAQQTAANEDDRIWGPIKFTQRRRGALHGAVIRGTLI